MAKKFTNRNGKIRFYDGTPTNPLYLEIAFDAGDLDVPTGRNLPELRPIQALGLHDAQSHYIEGSHDCYIEGLEMSFSALLTNFDATDYLEQWIKFLNGDGTTVNGITIVTTKGTTKNDGTNFNPAFPSGRNSLNVEFLLTDSGDDKGYQFNEVYFPYSRLRENQDSTVLAFQGSIFGTIVPITSFTSGGIAVIGDYLLDSDGKILVDSLGDLLAGA